MAGVVVAGGAAQRPAPRLSGGAGVERVCCHGRPSAGVVALLLSAGWYASGVDVIETDLGRDFLEFGFVW
jgi:hypothetical protein